MVRRRIDRVQSQVLAVGNILYVVLSARRYNDRVAIFYLVLVSVDKALAATTLETKKLVVLLVRLDTDLFARTKTHQDKLAVLAGVEYLAEVVVVQCVLLNI